MSEDRMVAALFVEKNGVYAGLEGVDLWDEERDARLYAGPYPVVAHPMGGNRLSIIPNASNVVHIRLAE